VKGNRICQLLGIRYPIVQAPMNWITGADLVAAVSNAGGLGTLGPNAGADTITRDVVETKVKQAVIQSRDDCTVTVNKWVVAGRDLKNTFTKKYSEMIAQGASVEGLFQEPMYRALVRGDVEEGELPCGQSAGTIGNIISAAEVIESMMREIRPVLEQLEARMPADLA
jgi:NAD(P)H-dependent flavin oxidoreductase YrpB (nitropropane dioxygenase family)